MFNEKDHLRQDRAALVAKVPQSDPMKLLEAIMPAGTEQADIVCLADIEREEIEWLWPGVLAVGKLHVIAGNPGEGKSTIALDIAARITNGHLFPFEEPSPAIDSASVVLFAGEDDPADTLRPRLEAAGANVQSVFILQGRSRHDGKGGKKNLGLTLTDLLSIEDAIKRAPNCKMLVIDPLMAFMGTADSHKDSEVRGLLQPLGQLAAKYRVAVLIVAHLNKGKGTDAAYRVGGSIGISAAARIVLGVGQDRKDKELRWLTPIKCNIAKDRWGMAYAIEEFGGSTRIVWKERNNDMNAQDLWAEPSTGESDREELDAITKAFLATKTGGAKAGEVIEHTKTEGYGAKATRSSLHRVARQAKAGFQGETRWCLKY